MHLECGCILSYCTGRVKKAKMTNHAFKIKSMKHVLYYLRSNILKDLYICVYIYFHTGKQVKKRQTMKVFYISVEDLHEADWATEVKHNSFVYKV